MLSCAKAIFWGFFLKILHCSFKCTVSLMTSLPFFHTYSSASPYALVSCPGCRLANTLLCHCPLSIWPCCVTCLSKISAFWGALFWWLFVVMKLNGNWLAISLSEWRSRASWVNECQCQCPVLKTNNLIPPRAQGARPPVGTHLSSA